MDSEYKYVFLVLGNKIDGVIIRFIKSFKNKDQAFSFANKWIEKNLDKKNHISKSDKEDGFFKQTIDGHLVYITKENT